MRTTYLVNFGFFAALLFFATNCGTRREPNLGGLSILHKIDSLAEIDNDNILLIITAKGCDICDIIFDTEYYKNLPFGKTSIDIMTESNHRLLAQALYTKGFPTGYLINSKFEIIGITEGTVFFEKQLDSILLDRKNIFDFSIKGVDSDSIPSMLSYSLKSLKNYWEGDIASMKNYAIESREKGSYFFNNYLLYLAYKDENKRDSMSYYKHEALKHSHNINAYMYDDLIVELTENR